MIALEPWWYKEQATWKSETQKATSATEVLRLRQQAEHMQGSERSLFQGMVDNSCMRVVLGPHDNMNWESLCKLLSLLLTFMYYMFQDLWWHWTSHRVCQWQVWQGKEMQWRVFWCVWEQTILKRRDVVSESNLWSSLFFSIGKPGELTLLSVLPELSRSLGLGEQELQVVRSSGK